MRKHKTMEEMTAEQATGCDGAGDYRRWAESQGYNRLAVVDWTSSAGDWSFIVSNDDGRTWYPMYQENNWPRRGFTRTIDESRGYEGTEGEALELAGEGWY